MKKGILIFAHNSRSLDYALMSIISGGLAKKHLNVPASLVTDTSTVEWMRESNILNKATEVFENLIIIDRPETNNTRMLHDGNEVENVSFINSNRMDAWSLSPYDRTLLIDSDFLIFSDRLGNYWDVDESVLIGESINDIDSEGRLGYHDVYISDVGIGMSWATTVMFSKDKLSKLFFDTVSHIKENYKLYSDIFRFDSRQYRNDIAFSVARHIINGFQESELGKLPPVLSVFDKDILDEVNGNKLIFLTNTNYNNHFYAASLSEIDIHIMNKQSIIRNKDKLLELI